MSGVGTHEGLTHRKRPRGREDLDAAALADVELEQLIVELYSDGKGHAPYTWRQRRNLVAATWWLVGVLAHEPGDVFHRSWPQIIRAFGRRLGWDVSGDVEELKRTHGPRTKLLIGYLQVMGLLEGWSAVPTGRPGEYAGIHVEITPAARSILHAQLSAERLLGLRRLHRRRRGGTLCPPAEKTREIVSPSGEHGRARENSDPLIRCDTERKAVPAPHALRESTATTATRPSVDANRPDGTATGGAALERLRTAASGARARAALAGGGPLAELEAIRLVLERASAKGWPSWLIAIAGFEQMRRVTGHSGDIKVHPKRFRTGFVALDVADRYGAFGQGWTPGRGQPRPGVEQLLHLMELSALDDWEPLTITSRHPDREADLNHRARGTVVSLSHFLCAMGQIGREWRRQARERGGYNRERKGRRQGTARARRRRGRAC